MMSKAYGGSLTREQFMFREMRIVAKLIMDGQSHDEIKEHVYIQNLFQYPTQRTIRSQVRACLHRFDAVAQDDYFTDVIANGSLHDAKQAVLVSMMRQNALVGEFMVRVIGNKYRTMDMTICRKDMNVFFQELQQQSDQVAGWSDATIERIKGVLSRCLIETEYMTSIRENKLNPVLATDELIQALRRNGLSDFLPAFNVFE